MLVVCKSKNVHSKICINSINGQIFFEKLAFFMISISPLMKNNHSASPSRFIANSLIWSVLGASTLMLDSWLCNLMFDTQCIDVKKLEFSFLYTKSWAGLASNHGWFPHMIKDRGVDSHFHCTSTESCESCGRLSICLISPIWSLMIRVHIKPRIGFASQIHLLTDNKHTSKALVFTRKLCLPIQRHKWYLVFGWVYCKRGTILELWSKILV